MKKVQGKKNKMQQIKPTTKRVHNVTKLGLK